MGLNNVVPGFNSATEFMVSGLPWTTSSVILSNTTYRYDFPKITKRLSIWNHNTGSNVSVRVGFTQNGVELGNYFKIESGEHFEFDTRIKQIFLRSDTSIDNHPISLYAELTNIDSSAMSILTGSINGETLWEGVG